MRNIGIQRNSQQSLLKALISNELTTCIPTNNLPLWTKAPSIKQAIFLVVIVKMIISTNNERGNQQIPNEKTAKARLTLERCLLT